MKAFVAAVDQSAHAIHESYGSLKICVWFGGDEYQWLTKGQVMFTARDSGKDWKAVWAEGMKNRLAADLSSMGWLPIIQSYEYTNDAKTSFELTVQHNAEWEK